VWFPRRAMHASGDSPCRSSAKRHLLKACFLLMAPFRGMLLTSSSGRRCLAPKTHRVPVYPKAFLHSSMPLSRRTLCDHQEPFLLWCSVIWTPCVLHQPSGGSGSASASLGKRCRRASSRLSNRVSSLSRSVTCTLRPAISTYTLQLAGASGRACGATAGCGSCGFAVSRALTFSLASIFARLYIP
jgi:hypothetical protein